MIVNIDLKEEDTYLTQTKSKTHVISIGSFIFAPVNFSVYIFEDVIYQNETKTFFATE